MKKIFLLLAVSLSFWACQQEKGTVIRMETSCGDIRFRLYEETPLHRDNMIKLVKEGFYEGILFHRVIRGFMVQTGDPTSKGAGPGIRLGHGSADHKIKAEILPQYFHKKGVIAAAREGDAVNPERNSSGSHFYIAQGQVYTKEMLNKLVENINNNRFKALYNQFKEKRKAEILGYQEAKDEASLERINQELIAEANEMMKQRKLELTEEQIEAYTSEGGIPHLDGEYTVFGEVIEGLEVVDKIAAKSTDMYDRPQQDVVIKKMVIE